MEEGVTTVQLRCPRCGHFLEKSKETYRCPVGHVELNTTPEGYPILKESGGSQKQLLDGGDFKEGALWRKAISRCKKVVFIASLSDREEELKPLRDYLTALRYELKVMCVDEMNKRTIDRQALIVCSRRIGRKNMLKILLKYLRHPFYRYIPGSVVQMRLPKLVREFGGTFLYKLLLDPIVSRRVEAWYERYLVDTRPAQYFGRTHLPQEIQNGKGLRAFDIGCGRGRHVAMLTLLGFKVIGMDLQTYPYWRRLHDARFCVGSTDCLPYFPDKMFDLITCMQVLMYLADEDAALAHIKRMLRRGGYFLVQVTNKDNLHTVLTKDPLLPDPYLQRYYSQSELCNKLKQNGFTVDRVWTERFYTPFFVLPGNLLYDFILNEPLRESWDKLVQPRYLGLINILARPS